jgi:hypothetical protein
LAERAAANRTDSHREIISTTGDVWREMKSARHDNEQ